MKAITKEVEREWAGREMLECPISLQLVFFLENPTFKKELEPHFNFLGPDCGNMVKSTQDAISDAGVWRNDAQIFHNEEIKLFCEDDLFPRIEAYITPFTKPEATKKIAFKKNQ